MIDEKKLIEKIWNIFSETYNNAFKFDEDESKLVERVMIDVQHAIEEQPKIGGWIPCSERLPEENQNVIACFAHGTVTELQFYDKKFHGIYDYDEKVIVAWQPLPEAYHE